MTQLQIGAELTQTLSERLSNQLHSAAARYGLDTQETEALIASVFTETESRSQNSSREIKTWMTGLLASLPITSEPGLVDVIFISGMQALDTVRYAVILRKPNRPPKFRIYLGRKQ